MKIEVFDVDHGQCIVVTGPNGKMVMIDCGVLSRGDRLWWPSIAYMSRHFERVVLTNLDEDHVEDFGGMMKRATWSGVASNPTINADRLLSMKQGIPWSGVQAVLEWLRAPKLGEIAPLDLGGVQLSYFWNSFIPGGSNNTNDLSLVVLVQFGGFKLLIGGDMHAAGWRRMLAENANFRAAIANGVTMYVASHHGRSNGQCQELFDAMSTKPLLAIMSDDEIEHETQGGTQWYANRVEGAGLLEDPSRRRYVYTTRNDGSLRVEVNALTGAWTLKPFQPETWPRSPAPSAGLGAAAQALFGSR